MDQGDRYQILVTGHRNPDIDSLAAAAALAELRRRQGEKRIAAICPGVLPERARYLFDRFKLPPPASRNDVYIRIADVTDRGVPTIPGGMPLLDAVRKLGESGYSRLPVTTAEGKLLGMLSPLNLLSHLLDIGNDAEGGLTGRRIYSSLRLIEPVISAEVLTEFEPDSFQEFLVYVAAMGVESFEAHLPRQNDQNLIVICGDRPEIHLRTLQRGIRLLIVTGDKEVEPLIAEEARRKRVTVLRTALDSAAVIRRLKFSVPVEHFGFSQETLTLRSDERLRGLENKIVNQPEDVIPVIQGDGSFHGVVLKKSVASTPSRRLIMVDHNEIEQSIPGAEELPVVEVVDHHRIGMMPTANPIKFTGDTVGSTCTLIARMYKSAGESLNQEWAGLLLGGIVADTLNLKSPTTSPEDRRVLEWLEKLSGIRAAALMDELSSIDSPLASKSASEVIASDRKNYADGKFKFALSQVEESNLELLHQRRGELSAELSRLSTLEKLDFIGLLVTDAVREISELLILGRPEIVRALPYESLDDELFRLPGVLSRKKQLLPQILAITGALNRTDV